MKRDLPLIAPGARVVIRDEEWLVRAVDPSADGGHLLTCDGISELVRGRQALFLTRLEGPIAVLDPVDTQFVTDRSSNFNDALLYLETQYRRSVPNDDKVHVGHRAAMNLVRYQLDPALKVLRQPRARHLIADAVGLGKTLEAGILCSELIARGRGRRILVVTLKSMLTQFQKEFWTRFTIPLVRLDSAGLQRVRNTIPSNHNPFNYYDRTIISIDTLKGNHEYRNYLENAWWDIIVIDECHNVAARAGDDALAKRAKLARLLAKRSDALILLSATPHDGSARSFASLMSLLDPTAISDPDDYTPEDFSEKQLVTRRFKKDIRDQVSADFQERETLTLRQHSTAQEDAAYRALLAIPFTQSGRHNPGRNSELQRIQMQKGLFSSPAAALVSARQRLKTLSNGQTTQDQQREADALVDFIAATEAITPKAFSKFQKLVEHLKSRDFNWNPLQADDRLVIFSERIETLNFLQAQLPKTLGQDAATFEILTGAMSDQEQQDIVDRFGRKEDSIRVLLCSDVASEGLNLHYFCHRLVHFDLPWSLMVFQQRNGRVDRYGQSKKPLIVYLMTETEVERIKGDMRVLEVLQTKDEQANKNLGDPSCFLRQYDSEKEADAVAGMMAGGISAEEFERKLDANASKAAESTDADALLADFFAAAEPAAAAKPAEQIIAERFSLFTSDFDYACAGLRQLDRTDTTIQFNANDTAQTLRLTAPRDLQERLKAAIPVEVRDSNHVYTLCADPATMMRAIESARQAKSDENTWPDLQYLWPLNPVMEWLGDRVFSTFGRQTAPVVRLPSLGNGAQAIALYGLIPNRKGQPLLVDWQVAILGAGQVRLEPFADFAARTGLKSGALSNRGEEIDASSLKAGLVDAVRAMRQRMVEQHTAFSADLQYRMADTLKRLQTLQDRQIQQLELRLEQSRELEQVKGKRRRQRTTEIQRVFDDYRTWVQDTMTTEPEPYIQVLAGFTS